uniref:DUF1989 domain-containing protein n=1 Tax=Melanopsichium pennsylvanicum 4 TaxID=1398559 RepID=A0A077R734_9BASI|nr:conserved hypothetical protein [Melanopsichium pennsylvanicum 4]
MKSFAFVLSALVLAGGTTATTMPHFKQERYKVDPSGLMVCEGGYELFCSVTFQQLSIPRACFKAGFKVADAFDRRIDPLNGYISENKTNFVVKTDDTEEFTLTPPGYAPIKVALYNPNRPVQIQTYDEVNAITEYKQSHQGKEPPEGCLAVAIYTQKKGYSLGSQTTDAFTHCPGTDKPIDLEVYKELSLVHDLKDSKVSHGEAGLNPRSSSKKAVDPPSSLRVLDVGYNLYCDPKTKDMTTPRVCIKTGVDMSDAIDQTQSDWLEGFTNHDSTSIYGEGGNGKGGGVDAEGGRVHDLLGTRCDPYVNKLLTGQDFDYHCHSNLTRAVREFGLDESVVHDVLNVFQCTGLNSEGKYFMKTCPAVKGDYLGFFAETDLLCALSTCPGGDLSVAMWGEGSAGAGDNERQDPTLKCCRPLGVEVYDLVDKRNVLGDWSEPEPYGRLYKGQHGARAQHWAS